MTTISPEEAVDRHGCACGQCGAKQGETHATECAAMALFRAFYFENNGFAWSEEQALTRWRRPLGEVDLTSDQEAKLNELIEGRVAA